MKNLAFILLAMTSLLCSSAHSWDSDRLRQHITIELWPDGAPTDNGVDYAHLSVENNRDIKPQMHVFLPDALYLGHTRFLFNILIRPATLTVCILFLKRKWIIWPQ